MHRVSGLDLKFTSRTSWMADVYKGSKVVATVPVAWRDQIIFDSIEKKPKEFLVWHRNEKKAQEWMQQIEGIIAIAEAYDPSEQPRRFKEFLRLYKVTPIGTSNNPLAIRAGYLGLITSSSFK